MKVTAPRVILNRTSGAVSAEPAVKDDAKCQVHIELDEDGNVIDGPRCINVSCTAECELQQEEEGSTIKYWCDCN